MLPIRVRVDLVVMAIKGYCAYRKTPALLEPHHQFSVIFRTLIWGDLPLSREAVGVFSSPHGLGHAFPFDYPLELGGKDKETYQKSFLSSPLHTLNALCHSKTRVNNVELSPNIN